MEYIVGHSVAGDIEQLVAAGLPVRREWVTGEHTRDSLLLARMVDENDLSYELENTLFSFANTEPWKHKTAALFKKCKDFALIPQDLRRDRCRLDAWASFQIARHFSKQLIGKTPLVEYTHRIASTLNRVTLAGAFVDLPTFQVLDDRIAADVLRTRDLLLKQAYAAGMESFEPTNDGHIRELLYKRLKLPVLSRTAKSKQPAVDKITLRNLEHPVAKLLLEYSTADKLYSVNITGTRKLFVECGRIGEYSVAFLPFRINPLGARTGRRASARPNSQNWPAAVRRIIRSRWADGLIGDFDYNKLEVIIIAWLAGDEQLLAAFSVGNGYLDVARELFGTTSIEADTPEYRAIKAIVLGTHYNMQAPKMAKSLWNLGIRFSADYAEHEKETARLRALYLRRFAGVRRYMEAREDELLDTGQVVSKIGRVRHLPVPDGEQTPGYGHLLNQAINFPVQSLAADITGSALVDIESELLSLSGMDYPEYLRALIEARNKVLTNGHGNEIIYPLEMSLIFNEVHDSLVVDLFPLTAKRDTELIVESMRAVRSFRKLLPGFDAPLSAKATVGPSWGQK